MLLLILGTPVLLYLFLQGFGENKFEVPVYFEAGIPEPLPGCVSGEAPHNIKQFVEQGPCERWDCAAIDGKLAIFSFIRSGCDQEILNQLARVSNNLREQKYIQVITMALDSLVSRHTIDEQTDLYMLPKQTWSWWSYHQASETLVKCGFHLNPDCSSTSQLVLIDSEKRIRGYYEASDLIELDRLITEFEILSSEEGN